MELDSSSLSELKEADIKKALRLKRSGALSPDINLDSPTIKKAL
jgi:hypothetical protein